jgi:hypothetical protein
MSAMTKQYCKRAVDLDILSVFTVSETIKLFMANAHYKAVNAPLFDVL